MEEPAEGFDDPGRDGDELGQQGGEAGGGEAGCRSVEDERGQGYGQQRCQQEIARKGAEAEPGQDTAGGLAAEADSEQLPHAAQ